MARRNSYQGDKWYMRPDQAYARTSGWPTRYYQRKQTGSMVAALSGLNTTSDDFAKREGESPYLWNARLNGTEEKRKRAQSMSRMGQKFLAIPEGTEDTVIPEAGDIKVAIKENHDIRWLQKAEGKTTRLGFRFYFDEAPAEDNHAHFIAIVRKNDANKTELCRAVRSLQAIYANWEADNNTIEWFRLIKVPKGDFYIQLSLVDDMDDDGNPNDFTLYLNSNGAANHEYADHKLPNLDKALREEDYVWQKGVSRPVVAYSTTTAKTFPVWIQNGYFSRGNERWVPVGAIVNGEKRIYAQKYADIDYQTGGYTKVEEPTEAMRLLIPTGNINADAKQVRMAQAGNHLYFVDGYSALQKVNLDDWTVSNAAPDMSQVDTFGFIPNHYYYASTIIIHNNHFQKAKHDFEAGDSFNQENWDELDNGSSITAWPGASLIYFLNNRLFLSGFRNATVGEGTPRAEPNLVIMSSIDSVMPRYDMFNRSIEFFYVKDVSPTQSSTSPVTAFTNIGDYLGIFTADGFVLEQVQAAVEFGGISQSTPEGSQYGVIKQEHVVLGRNNVYFLNPSMGVMRTAGATATVISGPIDSEIQKMVSDEHKLENISLVLTQDILRVYYNDEEEENTKALIDYVSIPAHKSYWYRDNNTPVAYGLSDAGYNINMAVHSQYPCLFYIEDSLHDFDCAILYEYYTKYISTPDRLDHCIVRRIHVTTLQTFQSSVFIGLDYDHNNHPIVWRKFITPTEPGNFAPEDIFGDDQESGATNLDIRILTTDTRFVQLRLKQYCYDFQAEILMVGFEYGNRTVL